MAMVRGLALFFTLSFTASSLYADDELTRARSQLEAQIRFLDEIVVYVERQDVGRLLILKQSAEEVLRLIKEKGLAHMATIQQYQVHIVRHRYSEQFLASITTEVTKTAIEEVQKITEEIIIDRGFDDSPYTKITYSVFEQLKKQLDELKKLNIDAPLSNKITTLIPKFGHVLALAQEGDRPNTFEAAKELYLQVRALYPDLERISSSSPGFDLSLSIQGLAEFYREYAQID